MKFAMVHENYNVLDLERSLAFYEKALGLTEKRRKEAKGKPKYRGRKAAMQGPSTKDRTARRPQHRSMHGTALQKGRSQHSCLWPVQRGHRAEGRCSA